MNPGSVTRFVRTVISTPIIIVGGLLIALGLAIAPKPFVKGFKQGYQEGLGYD